MNPHRSFSLCLHASAVKLFLAEQIYDSSKSSARVLDVEALTGRLSPPPKSSA